MFSPDLASGGGRAAAPPARAWMWRIAHNLVVDWLRAAKPHIDLDSVTLVEDRPGPEARRQSNEVAEVLRREIAASPARQRAVLALVHDQELPPAGPQLAAAIRARRAAAPVTPPVPASVPVLAPLRPSPVVRWVAVLGMCP